MYEVTSNRETKKMMEEHTEWAVLVKYWKNGLGKPRYMMIATGNDKRQVEEEGHVYFALILNYEGYEFTVPTSEVTVREKEEWE